MTITLTPQEAEEYFYNALCNGLGYVTSGYDLMLSYKKEDRIQAKEKLTASACYEDVLMQILRDGGTLTLTDDEDEDNSYSITLKDVHERVAKTPIKHLTNMITENDDAETADVILQTVFLEDIIYG